MASLFGEEFEIKVKQPNVKTLVNKANGTAPVTDSAERYLSLRSSLSVRDWLSLKKTFIKF